MSETHNPYSTPETNVVTNQINHDLGFVKQFKRFTTWGVIGLAIITLGIYLYYWMINRTKILNGLLPENRIPMWLPYTVIGLGILNLFFSFLPFAAPDIAATLGLISTLFSLLTLVLNLVWVFKFRNRLNILSQSKKGDMFWLGGVLTFFFQIYYFQYKINEMHDASNMQSQIPVSQ